MNFILERHHGTVSVTGQYLLVYTIETQKTPDWLGRVTAPSPHPASQRNDDNGSLN